jgi:hypothetical protein
MSIGYGFIVIHRQMSIVIHRFRVVIHRINLTDIFYIWFGWFEVE